MKLIYMGTPDFSVGPLESLIKAGHEVVLVVTQPDKPQGRGKTEKFTPVKECALKYGIPVFQPQKIKKEDAFKALQPYCVSVTFIDINKLSILINLFLAFLKGLPIQCGYFYNKKAHKKS